MYEQPTGKLLLLSMRAFTSASINHHQPSNCCSQAVKSHLGVLSYIRLPQWFVKWRPYPDVAWEIVPSCSDHLTVPSRFIGDLDCCYYSAPIEAMQSMAPFALQQERNRNSPYTPVRQLREFQLIGREAAKRVAGIGFEELHTHLAAYLRISMPLLAFRKETKLPIPGSALQ